VTASGTEALPEYTGTTSTTPVAFVDPHDEGLDVLERHQEHEGRGQRQGRPPTPRPHAQCEPRRALRLGDAIGIPGSGLREIALERGFPRHGRTPRAGARTAASGNSTPVLAH